MHGIESNLSSDISLHTFVISWPGFETKALKIENSLSRQTGKVQVIHSHGDSSNFEVPSHWVILPNEAFYGAKFLKSLELCSSDVMLQIQADAHCDDWPEVVRRCHQAFAANRDLGLWAPLVDWTPWSLAQTPLEKRPKAAAQRVSMVDGIVWAFGTRTLDRLRELDFSINPFGRGIDLAAASFVMAQGFEAVVDPIVRVAHPRGSGYSKADANNQLHVFLAQLNPAEKLAKEAIEKLQRERLQREKRSPLYLARKFFRMVSDPLYRRFRAIPSMFAKKLT